MSSGHALMASNAMFLKLRESATDFFAQRKFSKDFSKDSLNWTPLDPITLTYMIMKWLKGIWLVYVISQI